MEDTRETDRKSHMIVCSKLQDILSGRSVNDDLDSVVALARSMTVCEITMTQMCNLGDLDFIPRMLQLVSRMPKPLQVRWPEQVGKIISRKTVPVFAVLLEFVEERIAAMDNVYGVAIHEANGAPWFRPPTKQGVEIHEANRVYRFRPPTSQF